MAAALRFLALTFPILGIALLVTWLPRGSGGYPGLSDETEFEAKIMQQQPNEEERALQERIAEIGDGFAGEVGIAVIDVQTGRAFLHNGDEKFPQQSVSKLWVAMTALDQADRGKLELDEPVIMRREDLTVFYQPIRNIVRARGSFSADYAELMRRALASSDNSANDRILRRVGGPEEVEEFLEREEIGGVEFGTDERSKQSAIAGLTWRQAYSYRDEFYKARDRVPEDVRRKAFEAYLADPVDGATPRGIAEALARLARGELLSSVSSALLLAILEQTKSGPRRLKGAAPGDWRIAHKTGTGQFFDGEQSGYNDVGLLTAPDGRQYAVAVMIRRTRASYAARMEMMQEVTRAVVEYDEMLSASPSPDEPL
ncbi:MAG: class A beta-lactamase [Qipengyuania sp.]